MANDQRRSDAPDVVRRGPVAPDRASSRLLRRGLDALDAERMVPLKVIDVIPFEDSVFVLSDDWDESLLIGRPSGSLGSRRSLIVHEFRLSGEFVQTLVLSLFALSDSGYLKLTGREPGALKVRAGFIYFFEKLVLSEDSTERLDYLFARNGERLAVWTHGDFVNQHVGEAEDKIPCGLLPQPDAVTASTLVEIYPSVADVFEVNVDPGDPIFGATMTFNVRRTNIGDIIAGSKPIDADSLSRLDLHQDLKRVFLPFVAVIKKDGAFTSSWTHMVDAADSIWLMGTEFLAHAIFDETDVYEYWDRLPGGDQFSLDGLDIEEAIAEWGIVGATLYRNEYLEEIHYQDILADGVSVLLLADVLTSNGDELDIVILLTDIGMPAGIVDPGTIYFSLLDFEWLEKDGAGDGADLDWYEYVWKQYRSHPVSGVLEHKCVDSGRLYSICRSESFESAIVITDIDTGDIDWFQPEVASAQRAVVGF